jgi:CDP-glucose 4,6-dehydratase
VEGLAVSGAGAAFWKQRPVLVTGATGLLGSWLVARLVAAGADVVCLVRDWVPQSELYRQGLDKRTRSVTGDVRDGALLERVLAEYEIKSVFHLAAQTIVGVAVRSPVTTFESNVAGTWALLEACRVVGRIEQVVIASSDKAYGVQPALPYTEDSPLQGRFPYDASKSAADLISQSYAATYGLPVGITRCGNFYGGGDLNWNRIVPGTIRSVLQGERPIIRSNGKFVRDYVFVEDGAAAYMTLAEKMAERSDLGGQAFNFSNEAPIDVIGLVTKILALMGSKLEPVIQNQASNEIPEQFLSASKARRELGWKPLFTLHDGLRRTVDWYTQYLGDGGR